MVLVEKRNKNYSRNYSFVFFLIALVILLVGIGLGFLYSASQPISMKLYGVATKFFIKQLIFVFIGLLAFVVALFISPEFYKKNIKIIVFITFTLLVLVLIPGISKEVMGAKRWIYLFGFSFQPSEIAKFVLICYLASIFTNKKEYENDFYRYILPALVIVSIFSFLILLENDFSTTFLLIVFTFFILFINGTKLLTLSMLILIGGMLFFIMIMSAPYRMNRFFAFINPWADPLGSGWQYIQSIKSFAIGKLFGIGIGSSVQKNLYLPEAHNDYIFSIIAEEGGAIFAILVVLIYFLILLIGLNISKKIEDRYRFLLSAGIILFIFIQAMVNIMVVLSLLPATGITLPFVSAGGTSVVVFFYMFGVFLRISLSNEVNSG